MEMELLSTQAAAGLLTKLLGYGKNWVTVLADARRPVQRRRNTLQPFCRSPRMLYRERDVRAFAATELLLEAERSSGRVVVEGPSELDIHAKLICKRDPIDLVDDTPLVTKAASALSKAESEELDEALDRVRLARLLLKDRGLDDGEDHPETSDV